MSARTPTSEKCSKQSVLAPLLLAITAKLVAPLSLPTLSTTLAAEHKRIQKHIQKTHQTPNHSLCFDSFFLNHQSWAWQFFARMQTGNQMHVRQLLNLTIIYPDTKSFLISILLNAFNSFLRKIDGKLVAIDFWDVQALLLLRPFQVKLFHYIWFRKW